MPETTTTSRRFTCVGEGRDEFWEIDVVVGTVTVRYGRTGFAGQSTSKSFPDAAIAQQFAEKLIREKTSRGYVEAR